MTWFKKAQTAYTDIVHPREDDPLDKIFQWLYVNEQIKIAPLTNIHRTHEKVFGYNVLDKARAGGRVDLRMNKGSCQVLSTDPEEQLEILWKLKEKFPTVSFLVFKQYNDANSYPNPEYLEQFIKRLNKKTIMAERLTQDQKWYVSPLKKNYPYLIKIMEYKQNGDIRIYVPAWFGETITHKENLFDSLEEARKLSDPSFLANPKNLYHCFFSIESANIYGFSTYLAPNGQELDCTETLAVLPKNISNFPPDSVYVGATNGEVLRSAIENEYFKVIPKLNGKPVTNYKFSEK